MPQSASSADQAEQMNQQRLLALINNMSDGFLALNNKFEIELSNAAALNLLDVNDVKGKSLNDVMKLLDNTGSRVDLTGKIADKGSVTSRNWQLNYTDGTSICLQISVAPIRIGFGNEGSSGFVALFRDITRERLLEEEKDEFISVVSHELRTPVTVAEGGVSNSLLLAKREGLPQLIIKNLETSHSQIVFLSGMLNDLAALSRAERGKLSLVVEMVGVNGLLSELKRDYEPQALEKKLSLEAKLLPEDVNVSNSRLYIREILQNFITNAIKYTEKGSVQLTASPRENGVEFAVIDTGFGIGRNEQSKLFEKFFRSDDWRVKKIKGTGLGLYVAGKLARLMEGQLSFESEINKGSTFKLYVPNIKSPVHEPAQKS